MESGLGGLDSTGAPQIQCLHEQIHPSSLPFLVYKIGKNNGFRLLGIVSENVNIKLSRVSGYGKSSIIAIILV